MSARMKAGGTETITVSIAFAPHHRRGRKLIIRPDGADGRPPLSKAPPNSILIKALGRAFRWRKLLESGAYTTVQEISEAEGVNASYVSRVLRLTLLSPMIVDALFDGPLPDLQAPTFLKPFPVEWDHQRKFFFGQP